MISLEREGGKRLVLYVGLEPTLVDFSSLPGLDAAKVQAGIAADIRRLAEHGYDATWCPVDRGETAEATLAAELTRAPYACVVIGAGVRTLPEHLLLFETLVNVVHERAPRARLCFNTKPTDTLEAVQRWA